MYVYMDNQKRRPKILKEKEEICQQNDKAKGGFEKRKVKGVSERGCKWRERVFMCV